LVAVGSRTTESARKFADEFGISRSHGSYEALLADTQVQAVYIATPHPQHAEWIIAAAKAGKHVLCEKPLSLTRAEASAAAEACRANKVLLMEAFMYRCHPQTAKVVELVRSGVLGRIGLVQAAFGFANDYDPKNRFWNKALGGGAILDVGCYPVSFSRLIAGADCGEPFANPVSVTGAVQVHAEAGVDTCAVATLQFASGLIAQVSTSISLKQDNAVRIYGTKGWLHVPDPWVPARTGGDVTFHHYRGSDSTSEAVVVRTEEYLYGVEADAFASALASGLRDVPQMSVDDTLGNMAVLDAWRACTPD
jgi:predicted dehydrogenase